LALFDFFKAELFLDFHFLREITPGAKELPQ